MNFSIPCETCVDLNDCIKKVTLKNYNIIGYGRVHDVSVIKLLICCPEYRNYIKISEENYVVTMNFFYKKLKSTEEQHTLFFTAWKDIKNFL